MKRRLQITGLLIALFFAIFSSKGQDTEMPRENIKIHLSEYCLFPGEMLWLSVYVSNEEDLPGKQISNMAFVEFINGQNNSLIRKKLILNKGTGSCSIEIPDTLSTGICHVLVYTKWMKNFGEESFGKSQVLVFNPNSTFNKNKVKTENQSATNSVSGPQGIALNKTVFQTREKVNFEIDLKDFDFQTAKFSVSVRQKEPAQILSLTGSFHAKNTNPSAEIRFLPDYKGVLFTGRLVNKTNTVSVADKEIAMTFPGESVEIKYAQTSETGDFQFLLEPVKGDLDLVLHLPSKDYMVKLDEPFVNGLKETPQTGLPDFDETTLNYLKNRFIRVQLQNRFSERNFIQEEKNTNEAQPDFFGQPYQTVRLKDYKTLDSISEYFYELIPTVHFSNKKGEQQLYLTNPETNFKLGDNPMVFVDGVFYPGLNELASINHNLVTEISVVPKIYYYRDKTFDGIVAIKTKGNNFNQVQQLENMVRLIYTVSDNNQQFSAPLKIKANIPDLRSLLHWETKAFRNNENPLEIGFYTSDIPGDYIISVEGMTDKGEFFSFEKNFTVSE
jgi:hypothetical protein